MAALGVETVAPDEAAHTAEFIAFLTAASAARYPTGPALRFNQGRHTGCVRAEFSVLDGLPSDCRVGLFAEPRTFAAWIRFASATSASDRERDVRGMSIKLSDVDGQNLTAGSTTQDFILNSHPVMIVGEPREFLKLLTAVEAGGVRRILYFLTHPAAARAATASRQHHTSHLEISYWSTTPYLFGPGRAVKYAVRPRSTSESALPHPLTDNYLREALVRQLSTTEASFDFMIQFQTDPETMPIEDAAVEWSEQKSPFRAVARIRIPPQNILDDAHERPCESVAFNPWNCLPDHRPLGSFNRARREIYHAMAKFREERAKR